MVGLLAAAEWPLAVAGPRVAIWRYLPRKLAGQSRCWDLCRLHRLYRLCNSAHMAGSVERVQLSIVSQMSSRPDEQRPSLPSSRTIAPPRCLPRTGTCCRRNDRSHCTVPAVLQQLPNWCVSHRQEAPLHWRTNVEHACAQHRRPARGHAACFCISTFPCYVSTLHVSFTLHMTFKCLSRSLQVPSWRSGSLGALPAARCRRPTTCRQGGLVQAPQIRQGSAALPDLSCPAGSELGCPAERTAGHFFVQRLLALAPRI